MFVKSLAFTFMSTDSRRVVSKAWNFAHGGGFPGGSTQGLRRHRKVGVGFRFSRPALR